MKHRPAPLILLICSIISLHGAEPAPKPPLLAPAPNPGRWVITTRSKDADQGAPPRFQTTVERSGARRRETTTSPRGPASEVFFIHGLSFRGGSGLAPGDVIVETASPAEGFPELAWIKAENFVETRREAGKYYHIYRWSPPVMIPPRRPGETLRPSDDPSQRRQPLEAWVDATTRLPVRVLTERGEKTYQFTKPATSSLEPTGDVRRRIELYFDGRIP